MRIFESIMFALILYTTFSFFFTENSFEKLLTQQNEIAISIEPENTPIEVKMDLLRDTSKTSDTIKSIATYYVIAGSFLIPSNAEIQIQKLLKLVNKNLFVLT